MGAKDLFTGRLLGNAQKFSDKQVAETLTMLIEHGVQRGASDIHIEPHDRFVLVRYRIDGVLRGIHKLPRAALGTLVAQLKALAGLQATETQMPQEGSYELTLGDKRVDVRLSTMPVIGGEKAVLHLTLELGTPGDLEALGFWGNDVVALQGILAQSHGLLLIAGPRHSGLASTLFSFVHSLNSPLVSIATLETHPKYHLAGVNQTYLTGGMAPRDALVAILKQDPNIIMLSDLADSASAGIAVHAASTGHFMLAGMHADGAVAALLRLKASGVEPFLLFTAFKTAVGQRLVRTLCPDCRERYALSKEAQQELAKSFGINGASAYKRIHDLERSLSPAIFGDVKQLSSTSTSITHLWRASTNGCDTCEHTGYKGRTAIVEVLLPNEQIQKALLGSEHLSAAALQAIAVKAGFVPMALNGLIKALRGHTAIAEVLRAISAEVA